MCSWAVIKQVQVYAAGRLAKEIGRQVTLCAQREQKLQHIGAYIDKLPNRLLAVCGDLLSGEYQVEGSIVDHRRQCKEERFVRGFEPGQLLIVTRRHP